MLINGKCEQCVSEGKTSSVSEPQYGITTLMGIAPGYYDETGNYVPPYNPNRTTYEWSCSQGHRWTEVK
jgi:hypothetical protein